jgi:hypothetical protein
MKTRRQLDRSPNRVLVLYHTVVSRSGAALRSSWLADVSVAVTVLTGYRFASLLAHTVTTQFI